MAARRNSLATQKQARIHLLAEKVARLSHQLQIQATKLPTRDLSNPVVVRALGHGWKNLAKDMEQVAHELAEM